MDWRILVVDDLQAEDVAEIIQGNKVVQKPDSVVCVTCVSFTEAINRLKEERFDIVILDLKDDSAESQEFLAGELVFAELKKYRFLPVIFHTGFPEKVTDFASACVKIVTRGDNPITLRNAVKDILDTKLPKLVRHIEEEQRKFMWESAQNIWSEDLRKENASDLVYILARRLANMLSSDVVKSFLEIDGNGGAAPKHDNVHAVELYVYPPVSTHLLFGDIFKRKGGDEYYVVLTPSCDLARSKNKADFLLLAKCRYLADSEPGKKLAQAVREGAVISSSLLKELEKFVKDNSDPKDRYKYLPGTSFLPDLLVDFQNICAVDPKIISVESGEYEQVASLDSPFAEALQAKMTRYMGRIGTPDIDSDLSVERFKEKIKEI